MLRRVAVSLSLLGLLSSCGHTPQERAASGALIGATAGALVGLASLEHEDDYGNYEREDYDRYEDRRHDRGYERRRHRRHHRHDGWRRHRDYDDRDWRY